MPPNFFDRSERVARSSGSLVCVGLDPDPERIPRSARRRGEIATLERFLEGIVAATRPHVGAYKFQIGSYFRYGPEGFRVLAETARAIGPERIRILDCKANDVPNTMRLIRDGVFDRFGFDAITITPWMGWDSLTPFEEDPAHGFFVVAHSSNPGSADLQDPRGARRPAWWSVLDRVGAIARTSKNAGVVVGATYPDAVRIARRRIGPRSPILLPGIGAQAGELEASVRYGLGASGGGVWVSASRSVLFASPGSDWKAASGAEAERLNARVNAARRAATRRRRTPGR